MAQSAKYASRYATYGSAAYDLDALKRGFDEAVSAEPQRAPLRGQTARPAEKTRTAEKVRVHAVYRRGVSVSAISVIGFAVAAVMIMLVVLSYVQIAEINDSKSSLRSRLNALNTEAEQLRVQYETTFNLNEIEEYAAHTLGMVRLSEGSTALVSSGREDSGVVLSGDGAESGALTGFAEFIDSLLEYFR